MPRTSDKRERLLKAARTLIHQQGFNQTTLSDIAEASGVPLGNVYYYFKTKDEIASAVISERRDEFLHLYQDINNRHAEPRQRLRSFLDMAASWSEAMAEYGCPVGSLCQELNNDRSNLSTMADSILRDNLEWVTEQFRQMGREDADQMGIQFVALMQGTSLLANSLHDASIVHPQIERAKAWLDTM